MGNLTRLNQRFSVQRLARLVALIHKHRQVHWVLVHGSLRWYIVQDWVLHCPIGISTGLYLPLKAHLRWVNVRDLAAEVHIGLRLRPTGGAREPEAAGIDVNGISSSSEVVSRHVKFIGTSTGEDQGTSLL